MLSYSPATGNTPEAGNTSASQAVYRPPLFPLNHRKAPFIHKPYYKHIGTFFVLQKKFLRRSVMQSPLIGMKKLLCTQIAMR